MATAVETRLAALERSLAPIQDRLNPGAARQRLRQAEVAEANDAFTAAAARRQKATKDYLPAIAKLRAAIEAVAPVSAHLVELVREDADAWTDQRRAVDHGATGDIDPKLPGAAPGPDVIVGLLRGLDDTIALARKYGLVR